MDNEKPQEASARTREMYNRHLESLRVLGENGSELPDGQTEKILDMHCRFAEDAIRKFDATLPLQLNPLGMIGINR